jgi:hypothetical protein
MVARFGHQVGFDAFDQAGGDPKAKMCLAGRQTSRARRTRSSFCCIVSFLSNAAPSCVTKLYIVRRMSN